MGLFDFAKDVGRQLFDTDAEAADNISCRSNLYPITVSSLSLSLYIS